MKIGVCIKEVADTASKIELRADGTGINESSLKFVMNPYDEFALEEALLVKDKDPQTEVVVISIGPERIGETIRKALAMGADRGMHVKIDGLPFGESLAIAQILSKVATQEKFDLLMFGKQAVDDDNFQVPPMVGALLNWPQAVNVVELQWQGNNVTAIRETEGGSRELVALQAPFLIGMTKGIHEPRYASLKGIMAAKKKETKVVTPQDFAVDVAALHTFSQAVYSVPTERQAVKMIGGDPAQAAAELVRLLREEAKVI